MLVTDATNLPRLMVCNGSRLMTPDPVLTERDDTIREEGNAAHWLASVVFTGQHTAEELVDRKAPNGVYITAEMAEHVHDYISAIDRSPRATRDMEWEYALGVAQKWRIKGRADYVASESGLLSIDDFKYGYSIVEPERNWTLIAHACGYITNTGEIPQQITFTIHQPRAPHRDGRVRHWTVSYSELLELHAEIDRTLSNPSDTLNTGPHCYKCPAFASCPARQAAELNGIEAAHAAYNANIQNDELTSRLDQISRAIALLTQSKKAYEELAAFRIKAGEVIENYTVENDLTNRTFHSYVTPELLDALYGDKGICERQLPTLKDATAAYGEDAVAMLTTRHIKGAKLVRVNASKKAERLFGRK